MDTKAVLKNIKNKGILETLKIHKKRKGTDAISPAKIKEECAATVLSETIRAVITEDAKKAPLNDGEKAYFKILRSAGITLALLRAISADNEKIHEAERILCEIRKSDLKGINEDVLSDWNKSLIAVENGRLKRVLKKSFIKEVLPAVYAENAKSKVKNRILFMQPRQGLNQTFRYLFRKLEAEGIYEPVLFEFHRGDVSYAEHFLNAVEAVREMSCVKAVMLHESSDYLGYIDFRPETKVIQLWHGCGVIKHLGLTAAGTPGAKSLADYEEFPEYNKYDLVTICSEEQRWVFEDFMGKEKGDPVIKPWGMSRTDEFFDRKYVENCYKKLHSIIPESKDMRVILYAPTYRGRGGKRTAPDILDISKFAESLSDDYILIIKHHQTVRELPEIPEKFRDSFAYDMTRGKGMDINELMTVADICISDYSSVVFEYSIFERPIIFFMFDLEDYSDERGMYYTYEELSECGPVFKENDEMIDYIKNIDERFDKEKVSRFKERFMSACDGHSCERILKFIES